MRFVELAIEAFQALERARVQLGPGLNVLYGPNDLGKSTLAGAIRAALLVQPRAAEAQVVVAAAAHPAVLRADRATERAA